VPMRNLKFSPGTALSSGTLDADHRHLQTQSAISLRIKP
jgi:hypothetical protein